MSENDMSFWDMSEYDIMSEYDKMMSENDSDVRKRHSQVLIGIGLAHH